jgi:hypothetical protein
MPVTFDNCKARYDSGKALLVEIPEIGDAPQWVPHSQIHDDSEVYRKGDEGKLVVSEWFATQKEWV